ncbi:SbcC/MukB-like Walker B domain-containing protein [Levilactobacillus suantsaiihabitans]|uniref:SbcC/MukB-like Walker B domain-containing protein n=1 Tax=Levilactobacillus suantsaiihabitans TaxID=2487722 RepID=UPI001CDBC029|nr:SbcC/MukB-like Walker B domain-containing protein [Levilactobacillus suantsaiihabitans]
MMELKEHLTPVSFHLRSFNKYGSLDLPAAENGNLTLIGENTAGKTTLANCFFPMLIDGSIATPSFNSAKGTDKLTQTGNPRNSARESRNFESMLLGWGSGAMKVRTGYSYMRLRSQKRQVILGLGAHRAVGEIRKPTWWFVVISNRPDAELPLITARTDGTGLNETEFREANAGLGNQLRLFNQAINYREYAATQVYGFTSGESLGKLAAVYRLLASPILTAGNARFTPIREALKHAQEGIDPQIIQQVADSQREVNRTKGVLERLKQAQTRLQRMKKEIFWRNLNHIRETTLIPYSRVRQDHEKKQEVIDQARQMIATVQEQLQLVTTSLTQVTEQLRQLRQAKADQQSIVVLRDQYQAQIQSLTKQLAIYQAQQKQLKKVRAQLAEVVQQQTTLTTQQQAVQEQQLRPLLTQLATRATDLPELMDVVTEVEPTDVNVGLADYIRQMKKVLTQYQADERAKERVSRDVQIVSEMRETLGQRIDQRLQGPLQGRVRKDLQQDNVDVHEAGAAKMNDQFQEILAKQQAALRAHPDLKVILDQADFLSELGQQQRSLAQLVQHLADLRRQLESLANTQALYEQQVDDVQAQMDPDFDAQQAQDTIVDTQQRRDALVIDTQIDQKIAQAEHSQHQFEREQAKLSNQQAQAEGRISSAKEDMVGLRDQLDQLETDGQAILQTLAPYVPAETPLTTILEALAFVQQHRSEVRNSDYADISDWIGRLIHKNNSDGIDRNALDTLFEERGYNDFASAMRQQRSVNRNGLTVVAFDINKALLLMSTDESHVKRALQELTTGNNVAQDTYMAAAVQRITSQYRLIGDYNQMLMEGVSREQSIKLKITLTPVDVDAQVITEACDPQLQERPTLLAEVQNRLEKLANDLTVADDDELFMAAAQRLLDTRQWSAFKVMIKRRQSDEDHYEEVDDKFVQSGGSGAEKAQAMVLPLLLVPKMVLQRAKLPDAPYLVMFDEFADKLDPETAKSFAKTIARFGFNFIATMPSGAQNKILADGVDNIAYDVIAPAKQDDGRFHENVVRPALSWGDVQ